MKKLAMALAAALACGWLNADLPKLKDADRLKIDELIGKDYLVKGKTVPRVLMFYKCEGFVHGDAIVCANEAFRVAAEKTGAFKVKFSDDYNDLKPESLAKYDVLVLNNTTNLKVKDNPFLAWSIPDFVSGGKGLVSLHAGCDNFSDCPAAANVAAGCFAGHPWGAGGTWSFEVADPKNPVSKAFVDAFKGVKFKMSDEIYQHRPPAYDDGKVHALVTLDFSDPEVDKRDRIRKESTFYPVSWLRRFGKGRVFYSTFGHDARAWTEPVRLRHFFDGYLYTAGLLKCDDTPRGFDMAPVRSAKTFEEAEMKLRDMLANGGNDWLVQDTIKKAKALQADPGVSPDVKEGIRRAMRGFGAAPVTPSLAAPTKAMDTVSKAVALVEKNPANFEKLMQRADGFTDKAVAEEVRLAAVKNAAKVPAAQLVAAYNRAPSDGTANRLKAAILARLARNGAKECEPLAAGALESEDEDLAVTAAYALRFIGTASSMPALVKALKRGGRVQREAEFAVQDIADPAATVKLFKLAEEDNDLFKLCARRADSKQLGLWTPFLKGENASVRKAAWRALSRQLTDKNLPVAVGWLDSKFGDDEVSVAQSAFKAMVKIAEQDDVDKYIGGAWKGATAPAKKLLANVIGMRPSPKLLGILVGGLSDASADIRAAAASGIAEGKSLDTFDSLMAAYKKESDDTAKRAELDAMLSVLGGCGDSTANKRTIALFKAVAPKDCVEVGKFMLRSNGVKAFEDLIAMFDDAKAGAQAKAAFKELYKTLEAGASERTGKPMDSSKWKATASRNSNGAERAIDGNAGSRWDTGGVPKAGDWFVLDLGENVFVQKLILHAEGSASDAPAGANVFVSDGGDNWTGPVASCDDKSRGVTEFNMNAAARKVKIVLTGVRDGHFWSIHGIEVITGISKEVLEKYRAIAKGI